MSVTKLCEIISEAPVCADNTLVMRRVSRNLQPDGSALDTVTFHNMITGAPVATPTAVAPADECTAAGSIETNVFCDDNGDIVIRVVDEVTAAVTWVDLAGGPVTPVAPVGICDTEVDYELLQRTMCHDDGAGALTTITEVVVVEDGVEGAPAYVDGARAAFTVSGVLTPGACPIPAVDIVAEKICLDDGAGNGIPGVKLRGVSEADGSIIWTRYVSDDGTIDAATATVLNDAACCC